MPLGRRCRVALAVGSAVWSIGAGAGSARAGAFWDSAADSVEARRGPPAPESQAPTAAFRGAGALARAGRYGEAVHAYEAIVAAGADTDPVVLASLAAAYMAGGRLREAEVRYWDAISCALADERFAPRNRLPDLTLAYYGLAVAFDRDAQPTAAREMMGRALALDPGAAVLTVAARTGGDSFFGPEADVFYYRGLAALVAGRRADAAANFRDFTSRAPNSPWLGLAKAHIAEATAGPEPVAGRRDARILATGTTMATGGLVAPEVDASWRAQTGILDGCLAAWSRSRSTVGDAPIRFAIETETDAAGRVLRARATGANETDVELARCAERAVETQLRLPAARATRGRAAGGPSRGGPSAHPSVARTEIIVGFPSP
jgi:tetratricopeptide (TPR) repeat protein